MSEYLPEAEQENLVCINVLLNLNEWENKRYLFLCVIRGTVLCGKLNQCGHNVKVRGNVIAVVC